MAAFVETFPVGSLPHSQSARQWMLRYTTRPPLGEPQFKLMKPIGDVHEAVIAIKEDDTNPLDPIPPPPRARTAPSQDPTAPSFRLQSPTPLQGDRPTTPVSLTMTSPSPTSPSQSPSETPTSIESSPRSHTSSATLVRKGSSASTGLYSPVMRSMFPRYDPTTSLTQQRYHPQVDINPALAASAIRADAPGSYSPRLRAQREPPVHGGDVYMPKGLGLHNAAKVSEELDNLQDFSSPDELVDLWALANGQTSFEAAEEYKLELSCDDLEAGQEIICFDSSTSNPLYSLSAKNKELCISRSHPKNNTTTIQVSAPTLYEPNASSPLIATIFPKLAELMAIDKSSSTAVEHRLDRKDSTTLQTEAIERAHHQEASNLLWDSVSNKYYLIHPTLLEDDSPTAFPIEVSSDAGTPRKIKILAPTSANPLIELSFKSLHLNIHAKAITSYSSLYLLDTLLSATLVLLLHLHRSRCSTSLRPTSPVTSAIPFFEPPPTFPLPLTSKTPKKERRLTPWSRSFFTKPGKPHSKEKRQQDDEESATATTQGSRDPSITAKLPHPPTSTFQIIDPADERLPRTTRAVLRLLYWGFECLFWALGVLVNLLAMLVVGLGKMVKIL